MPAGRSLSGRPTVVFKIYWYAYERILTKHAVLLGSGGVTVGARQHALTGETHLVAPRRLGTLAELHFKSVGPLFAGFDWCVCVEDVCLSRWESELALLVADADIRNIVARRLDCPVTDVPETDAHDVG